MTEARRVTEESITPFPIPWLEVPGWGERFGVVAGVTGRGPAKNPFDLGLASEQSTRQVLERWRQVQSAFPTFRAVVVGRQVHGRRVLWHTESSRGWCVFEGADGHACGAAGILLAVTLADCIPIYLVDPTTRAIALLHSGWRGTAADILAAGIDELGARVGSRPADLAVHVGVGICGDCYEVGSDVASACGAPTQDGERTHLDLRQRIVEQAIARGVREVSLSHLCSAHHRDRFMSHRGSGGIDGRMVALLGIRD